MTDNRGIYRKYVVRRTDGTDSRGQKHEGCFLFVIDVDHDPHAEAALMAYAKACASKRPELAADITRMFLAEDNSFRQDGHTAMDNGHYDGETP